MTATTVNKLLDAVEKYTFPFSDSQTILNSSKIKINKKLKHFKKCIHYILFSQFSKVHGENFTTDTCTSAVLATFSWFYRDFHAILNGFGFFYGVGVSRALYNCNCPALQNSRGVRIFYVFQ